MLINLYVGHHDELEVLCAPGGCRSCGFAGDDLGQYHLDFGGAGADRDSCSASPLYDARFVV